MSTIISRIGFCEECASNGSPKTNQPFLVFGSSSNALKVLYALHNGRKGFVPFFYKLRKVQESKIYYQRVCSICGIHSEEKGRRLFYSIDESKWSTWKATSLKNWNNLVLFKDTGFEI